MSNDYGTHKHFLDKIADKIKARHLSTEDQLTVAFQDYLETRTVAVVVFENIDVQKLAEIIQANPSILKPVIALCNIAARAIERDVGVKNLNTYKPRLTKESSIAIAGYIKPFLPNYVEIPSLCALDRHSFIDKEVRAGKGRWEESILSCLNEFALTTFRKRKFTCDNGQFEIDAASPIEGDIEIGVDVKRIEARRDIHKRCDEIVNKAQKMKQRFPGSKFAVVIYYPFVQEHTNVSNRLKSEQIDSVVFAGESEESIENSIRLMLKELKISV